MARVKYFRCTFKRWSVYEMMVFLQTLYLILIIVIAIFLNGFKDKYFYTEP